MYKVVTKRFLNDAKTICLFDHIIVAGGLLDEEGKMKGSALVMDFPSRAELDDYIANEPYVLEGVWEKIEVEQINVVISNPLSK